MKSRDDGIVSWDNDAGSFTIVMKAAKKIQMLGSSGEMKVRGKRADVW